MSAHADLDALRKALRDSELRVRAVLSEQFKTLHSRFGITPDSVTVSVFDVTTIGSEEREHVLGTVHLGITL